MFIAAFSSKDPSPVRAACSYSRLNRGLSRMTRILRGFGGIVSLAPAGRHVYNFSFECSHQICYNFKK